MYFDGKGLVLQVMEVAKWSAFEPVYSTGLLSFTCFGPRKGLFSQSKSFWGTTVDIYFNTFLIYFIYHDYYTFNLLLYFTSIIIYFFLLWLTPTLFI